MKVRIDFNLSTEQQRCLELFSYVSTEDNNLKKILSSIPLNGIEGINSFNLEHSHRKLTLIKEQLQQLSALESILNSKRLKEGVNAHLDLISKILENINLVSCWLEGNNFKKALNEKNEELQTLNESQFNNSLLQFSLNKDYLLRDYTVLSSPQLLGKTTINTAMKLCERYPNFSTINHAVNKICQKDLKGSVEHIKELDSKLAKVKKPYAASQIYLSNIIKHYIETRSNDKRNYKTTFFGINLGICRENKIAAAQVLLAMVNSDKISLETWDSLDPNYKAAMQQGDLGEIFKEFNQLQKGKISSTDDYLNYHIGFDGLS